MLMGKQKSSGQELRGCMFLTMGNTANFTTDCLNCWIHQHQRAPTHLSSPDTTSRGCAAHASRVEVGGAGAFKGSVLLCIRLRLPYQQARAGHLLKTGFTMGRLGSSSRLVSILIYKNIFQMRFFFNLFILIN